MISKRCLCARIGGADRKFHLQTNKLTTYNIGVRIDSADRWCPLVSGTASNCINVRVGGADYHTVDYIPQVRFTYRAYNDSQPYQNPYVIYMMSVQMLNSVTINKPVDIYLYVGNSYGSGSWTNVLSLPANTVSASTGNSYRYQNGSNGGYIKVGDWIQYFTITTDGTRNVQADIPEAQWGV